MGKLTNDGSEEERKHYSWIYDPKHADGKPRPVLNNPEELARLHEVLDRHFGAWNEGGEARPRAQIARVALMPVTDVEPALPPGETITESEARELLKRAIDAAGGQRQLAQLHGQGHALISKAVAGKRKLGITVLAMIGLTPDQVVPDPAADGGEV